MTYATLEALRSDLGRTEASTVRSPEYAAKMLHDVPESKTVDRTAFICERVAGKRVLDIGSSGPLRVAVQAAAGAVIGLDREASDGVIAFDLDDLPGDDGGHGVDFADLPVDKRFPEVVLCGEILEHLSNPGFLLQRLHYQYPGVPVIISVPNAFSKIARKHMERGTENVNLDHCSWFSYTTLKTLLGRYGYTIREHYWYGGPPYVAEGLIVVTE